MFKYIPAEEKHLDQLMPHFISTGYDIVAAKYNTLNLDAYLYVRDYSLELSA